MKLSKILFIFLACSVLGSITTSYAQATREIILNVDTKNPTPSSACYFTTDPNTSVLDNSSPESFTILANVGDNIVWRGTSSTDPSTTVNIKLIKYSRGPRIFSRNDIPGEGTVQATIIRGGQEAYKYEIHFTIGGPGRVYKIDPKIKTGQ